LSPWSKAADPTRAGQLQDVSRWLDTLKALKLSHDRAKKSTGQNTTLVHDSDTIKPLYPARYNDSPSTKFVFALFSNAKTSMLWTVDKDPGTPGKRLVRAYKRMARDRYSISIPGSSTLSREKRAKLKAGSLPDPNPLRPSHDGLATRVDRSVYQGSCRLSRWPGMISHLVSRWSWLNRWLDRWDNCRRDKCGISRSCGTDSPGDKALWENPVGQCPGHPWGPFVWQAGKELEYSISELPRYRLAGDDTW
jgi:hypothetical protein